MGRIHCGSTMLYLPTRSASGLEEGLGAPVALPSHGIPIAYFIEQYHSCFSVALAAQSSHLTPYMFFILMQDGALFIFSTMFNIFFMFKLLTTVMSSFNCVK